MSLPTPNIILNHPKFDHWYPGQEEALNKIVQWLNGPNRFLCASMPTGSGKSLLGVLASQLGGRRAAFLTVTKGLQGQLTRDFERVGMVDIRGQNSYLCNLLMDGETSVEDGPCHAGIGCDLKKGGCSYYDKLGQVKDAGLLVTNYSYYLAQTQYGDGLSRRDLNPNPIELLVCDEAHLAFQALESFMAVFLGNQEIQALGSKFPESEDCWEDWQEWASKLVNRAENEQEKVKEEIRQLVSNGKKIPTTLLRKNKHYGNLKVRLDTLYRSQGTWVRNKVNRGMTFTPLWPGESSHLLFQKTPKVLVMSATLSPKTADSLNIPEDNREWLEVPSYFPSSNSPIVHVKAARMNHRISEEDKEQWVTRIDQIINKRLDRKGIVFTVSYDRRNYLLSKSQHSNIIYTHDSTNVYAAVEKFKAAKPPAVLVSPTVTSGWDFPGAECEYVVIGKIPYPDSRDPVVKARMKEDKEWGSYLAMQTLVQESGRGTRSEDDKCEYLIVDNSWQWFWKRYREHAPKWFWQRVNTNWMEMVPDPLI